MLQETTRYAAAAWGGLRADAGQPVRHAAQRGHSRVKWVMMAVVDTSNGVMLHKAATDV